MEEIDLKELIDMFLKRKFLIIFVVIVFAAIGAIYTLRFITPLYQSSTSLILVQLNGEISAEETNSITTTDLTLNSKLIQNYKEIVRSKAVLSKVIENLDLDISYAQLKGAVSVTSSSDTELIKLTVTDADPEKATTIANETAQVFMDKVEDLFNVRNVLVLDVAETNYLPCNINLSKNIVIFGFVGAIIVFAYILLINMLDTTVHTDTDIERALHIPVLASIVLTEDSNSKKIKKRTPKPQEKTQREMFSQDISSFSYLNKDNYIKNDDSTDDEDFEEKE